MVDTVPAFAGNTYPWRRIIKKLHKAAKFDKETKSWLLDGLDESEAEELLGQLKAEVAEYRRKKANGEIVPKQRKAKTPTYDKYRNRPYYVDDD